MSLAWLYKWRWIRCIRNLLELISVDSELWSCARRCHGGRHQRLILLEWKKSSSESALFLGSVIYQNLTPPFCENWTRAVFHNIIDCGKTLSKRQFRKPRYKDQLLCSQSRGVGVRTCLWNFTDGLVCATERVVDSTYMLKTLNSITVITY